MNKWMVLSCAGVLGCVGFLWAQAPATRPVEQKRVTASGLTIIELGGEGESGVKTGDHVWVHYTGTLTNGTKFDSSRDRAEPFEFNVGRKDVILGWDEGLIGMKVGEKRKLIIPPTLGYGSVASGRIPADSTLVFEIELLGIRRVG